MVEYFDNLDEFLEHLTQAIRQAPGNPEAPRGLCEMSRMLSMRCVIAQFAEDEMWNPEMGKRVLESLRDAIRACPDSVYQNNISARARSVSELIKRGFGGHDT